MEHRCCYNRIDAPSMRFASGDPQREPDKTGSGEARRAVTVRDHETGPPAVIRLAPKTARGVRQRGWSDLRGGGGGGSGIPGIQWRTRALGLGLAALVLAGCAGGRADGGVAGRPPGRGVVGQDTRRDTADAAGRGRLAVVTPVFCPARPSASLRAELDRTVPQSLRGEVVPLGMSPSGATAYVSAWTAGFAGVAALDLATGRLRPIHPFRDPATDQADGASGGRWLAWAETYSLTSLDQFTVYAWDSVTGRLLTLGRSINGPGGTPWPSPWHAPAVSGHDAAWAQGYGPGGEVEIRLADLATGQVRVIRTGHTQPPFFDRDLVVWPESDRPGAQTTLHAFSLTSGRPAALPPVLRAVHGTEFVVTDGTRTAYLSPDLTTLYYSPAPDQQARPVLRLPAGGDFSGLAMSPGALAWTTTAATYLASTQTGAYVQVTPRYGNATGSGSVVVISDAPSEKADHPVLPMHVISAARLTWPACPA
jgi:hypothetical protein